MEKRTTLTAIALLLMIVLAIYLRYSDHPPSAPAKTNATPAAVSALIQSPGPHRHKARIVPVRATETEFDPFQKWPLDRILAKFMVPPGVITASTTDDLVAQLDTIYTEYGGPGLDIAFQAPGDFDPPISINHDNIDFAALLKLIGIVANQAVHIDDSKVTLTEKPALRSPADEVISTQLHVPGSLLAVWEDPADDPFAEPKEYDPKRAFERYGIALGDDVEIDVDHNSSRWSITGPAEVVDRIKALVEVSFGNPPVQLQIEHKFFAGGDGDALEPQTFATQEDYQAAVQELIASPEVTLTSHPSLVTRPGQMASVEVVSDLTYPTGRDADGNLIDEEVRIIGMSLPVTPSLAGLDRIHISASHETNELRDQTLVDGSGRVERVLTEDDFRSAATDIEGQLHDQNTALIPLRQADGTTVYQFLSVQRLDPAGNPIATP